MAVLWRRFRTGKNLWYTLNWFLFYCYYFFFHYLPCIPDIVVDINLSLKDQTYTELRDINFRLWDIEDEIRSKEETPQINTKQ